MNNPKPPPQTKKNKKYKAILTNFPSICVALLNFFLKIVHKSIKKKTSAHQIRISMT